MNRYLIILLLSSISYSQLDNTESISKTGTTSAQFLKIGADARGTSMGNAFTAMSGGVSSMYWNPAGMTSIRRLEAVFLNSDWIAGITYNYTALGLNLGQVGVIGLSMTTLSTPEDLVRTVEKPNGTGEYFDANDLALNLSYAKRLTNKFSLGANIKYISQSIWQSSANTFAADLGLCLLLHLIIFDWELVFQIMVQICKCQEGTKNLALILILIIRVMSNL